MRSAALLRGWRSAARAGALGLALSGQALACGSAPGAGAASVRLLGVMTDGGIETADGRAARAPGVRIWPDAAREAGLALAGREGDVAPGADRWGRVALADPAPGLALLAAGLAIAVPEEAPPGCAPAFLAAEDQARRGRRGFWGVDANQPLDAARGEAVAARAGAYLVMQGRVAHVGWTPRAAYLNFGRPGEGASAELSSAARRALERQGWTRETMRGQIVRVRGVVAAGRSARVLVESAEAVEWLR